MLLQVKFYPKNRNTLNREVTTPRRDFCTLPHKSPTAHAVFERFFERHALMSPKIHNANLWRGGKSRKRLGRATLNTAKFQGLSSKAAWILDSWRIWGFMLKPAHKNICFENYCTRADMGRVWRPNDRMVIGKIMCEKKLSFLGHGSCLIVYTINKCGHMSCKLVSVKLLFHHPSYLTALTTFSILCIEWVVGFV